MSVTDAIWLFRRRVVATSLREGGSVAARRFGVHRSTVYEWRRAALAYGEDGLRVRERRPPRMPNAYDFLTERRIVAVALAWPTRGCDFFAGVLGQQGHRLSRTGIQKCLHRKGLGQRAERLALLEAQQLLDHGLVTSRTQGLVDRAAKRIRADRPGELVCFDTLYVGELKEVGKVGKVWALIAIDAATSWTWVRIVNRVTQVGLASFLDEIVAWLAARGARLECAFADNGPEYVAKDFAAALRIRGARLRHSDPGKPWQNGKVERFCQTLLHECFRVFFSRGRYNGVRAVQRDVDAFLGWYNRERPHQGHANRGLTPADRMRELGCPA